MKCQELLEHLLLKKEYKGQFNALCFFLVFFYYLLLNSWLSLPEFHYHLKTFLVEIELGKRRTQWVKTKVGIYNLQPSIMGVRGAGEEIFMYGKFTCHFDPASQAFGCYNNMTMINKSV